MAPAKAGSAEVKRGGTLRINLSTTDYEFLGGRLVRVVEQHQVRHVEHPPARRLVGERGIDKRNRPANADRIVVTTNTDVNQSLLQVRANQVDYDQFGLPPTAHDDLSQQYGIKKGGNGRYFVTTG